MAKDEQEIVIPEGCVEAEESSYEPEPFTAIVNEATGEIEQRLPLTGKIEIADPDDPESTIEVTPAQLRDLSIQRTIDHDREQARKIAGDGGSISAAQALSEVQREAEAAGEQLSAAETLARAEERAGSAPADPPARELLLAGEPVKLAIEKVR